MYLYVIDLKPFVKEEIILDCAHRSYCSGWTGYRDSFAVETLLRLNWYQLAKELFNGDTRSGSS